MTEEMKTIAIKVSGDDNESFHITYEPGCVWLHCSKRELPMPIGNLIYPYKTATIVERIGKSLTLKIENKQ